MESSEITINDTNALKYQKTTKQLRARAIQLFDHQTKNQRNSYLAHLLGVSLRKLCQMKQQYKLTGTIELTKQFKHSQNFTRRSVSLNQHLRNYMQANNRLTLKQIQQKLTEIGYDLSITNISYRLQKLGINHRNMGLLVGQLRSESVHKNQKYDFSVWIQSKSNHKLFYLTLFELKFLRNQHKKITLCLTLGTQGIVGLNYAKEANQTSLLLTHIQQNFLAVKKTKDVLLIQTEPEFFDPEIGVFLDTREILYQYLPGKSAPVLSPLTNIVQQIKLECYKLEMEELVGNLIQKIEHMLFLYPIEKIAKYYDEMREYCDEIRKTNK